MVFVGLEGGPKVSQEGGPVLLGCIPHLKYIYCVDVGDQAGHRSLLHKAFRNRKLFSTLSDEVF